jgi:hypothetical protein
MRRSARTVRRGSAGNRRPYRETFLVLTDGYTSCQNFRYHPVIIFSGRIGLKPIESDQEDLKS